ncbi:MAG: ribonuclease III [Bacteroidales bacterium]|nr:ribonuclease III [Bacteroidales bacterium]
MISLRYKIKLLFCDKSEKEFCTFVKTHLGFVPSRVRLYKKALTHKSVLGRCEGNAWGCNERLEFLGDSILDSIISEFLFTHYAREDEGFLTKMRSKIVNRKSLNEMALHLHLEKYIIANNLNLKNNNALGNAFEALIGAIYMDKGYNFTRNYVIDTILKKYINFSVLESTDSNFKSQLIEITQRSRRTVNFLTAENPEESISSKQFMSKVLIDDVELCKAYGYTKKEAEQNASEIALQIIEQ